MLEVEASVVFQNLWVEAEKGYRQKLSAEDGRHLRWRFWAQLSTRICRWRRQLQVPGRGFRWRLVFVSTDLLTDGGSSIGISIDDGGGGRGVTGLPESVSGENNRLLAEDVGRKMEDTLGGVRGGGF